ncbi:MAG TPA: hypothetical protein PLT28_00115 [Saprospiraceae bacterium]|nr:hypothetical protein [Saprospiraceae bacterium]
MIQTLGQAIVDFINKNGYQISDVNWAGWGEFRIALDEFWAFVNSIDYYDFTSGNQLTDVDIVVCGDNWWIETENSVSDFSQWLCFYQLPQMPQEAKKIEFFKHFINKEDVDETL